MSDEENGFDNGADIKAGLIIHHESILHLAFLDATIRHCVFDALIEWMVDGIYSPPDNRRAALVFELIARKNAMQIAKYRETLEKKSDAGRISGESRRKRAELNRCSTGVEQELNRCSTGVEQVLNYKKGNNKGNKKEKEKENISRPVAVRARACVNGHGGGFDIVAIALPSARARV